MVKNLRKSSDILCDFLCKQKRFGKHSLNDVLLNVNLIQRECLKNNVGRERQSPV